VRKTGLDRVSLAVTVLLLLFAILLVVFRP